MKKILLLMFILSISLFGLETENQIFSMKEYYVEGKAFTGILEYKDPLNNGKSYIERGEYKDGFLTKAILYVDEKEIGHIIYDKGKLISEYIESDNYYISTSTVPPLQAELNKDIFAFTFSLFPIDREIVKIENGRVIHETYLEDKLYKFSYKYIEQGNSYKVDIKSGVSLKIYTNGTLITDIIERKKKDTNDIITTFKSYYDDGTLWKEFYIVNQNLTGEYKSYFPNGQLETSGVYQNGRNIGIWKRYYQNGKLYQEINYNKDGFSGSIKEYYDTGELYGEGYTVFDKKNNNFKVYDKNKNLLKELFYYKGNIQNTNYTDKGQEYYKDYVDNYKYIRNGQLDTRKYKEKDSWNEDEENSLIREGNYEIYYDNGFLKEKVKYVNGRKIGKVTNYDRNGGVLEIIDYDEINEKEDIIAER